MHATATHPGGACDGLTSRCSVLAVFRTLAIGLLALFVIASFVDGVHQVATWPRRTVGAGDTITWVGSATSVLAGIPVVACAYACHQNLFPIIDEIKRPTVGRLRRVANGTMYGIMVIYLLCAMSGYLTFLQGTNGDLLLNYAHTATFVPQVLLRAVGYCIGVALLASLPGKFPARRALKCACLTSPAWWRVVQSFALSYDTRWT